MLYLCVFWCLDLCIFWCVYFCMQAFVKPLKIRGQEFMVRLVDTAGQDEYSIFPHAYAIDIHGYCLVYRYSYPSLLFISLLQWNLSKFRSLRTHIYAQCVDVFNMWRVSLMYSLGEQTLRWCSKSQGFNI